VAGLASRRSVYLGSQPAQAGAHVLSGRFRAGAHPLGDLAIVKVEHIPMHHGLALLDGQLPDRAPQPVIGERGRPGSRFRRPDAVELNGLRTSRAKPSHIGCLAMGDRIQPGPQVLAVAQAWIGPQRGDQGVLQAVLRQVGSDAPHQEAMQLGDVVVDQALKGRQAHMR
jgi:hypothetical protein